MDGTRMRFIGPGDQMTLDGMEIDKGDVVELDELQIRRLREGGAQLEPATEPASTKTKPAAPAKKED